MPQTNEHRRELYATDYEYKAKVTVRNLKNRQSPERRAKAMQITLKWRQENPERYELQKRTQNLKQFGLTVEIYDKMHMDQKGLCLICLKPETESKRLAVDHDHATGKVRGLLCSRCNSSIGKFEESSELLRRAAEYIENSG